jgi:hypothetical protein
VIRNSFWTLCIVGIASCAQEQTAQLEEDWTRPDVWFRAKAWPNGQPAVYDVYREPESWRVRVCGHPKDAFRFTSSTQIHHIVFEIHFRRPMEELRPHPVSSIVGDCVGNEAGLLVESMDPYRSQWPHDVVRASFPPVENVEFYEPGPEESFNPYETLERMRATQ